MSNLGVQQPDLVQQGNITTAGGGADPTSQVVIVGGRGDATWTADFRGTFSGGTTIVLESSLNGKDWEPASGFILGSVSPALVQSLTGPGPLSFTGSAAALLQFRVRATVLAGGDDVAVTLRLSVATSAGTTNGAIVSVGSVQITDGVHGPVEVNPGSTPALASDKALTVVVRPDSVIGTEAVLPAVARTTPAPVSCSSSGPNTLVAGVLGQTIRVFKLFLVFATPVSAAFWDGASAAFDGDLPMLASGAVVLDMDEEPWFTTSAGNDFVLNLGSPCAVGGTVYYTQS